MISEGQFKVSSTPQSLVSVSAIVSASLNAAIITDKSSIDWFEAKESSVFLFTEKEYTELYEFMGNDDLIALI